MTVTSTKSGIFSDFTLFFYDKGILKYQPYSSGDGIAVFLAIWAVLVVVVLVFTGYLLLFPGFIPAIFIGAIIKSTFLKSNPQKYKDKRFEELKDHPDFKRIEWNNISQLLLIQKKSGTLIKIEYNEGNYEMPISMEDVKKLKVIFSKRLKKSLKY